ncbi:tripartite tricarboxylate transporter substrate-binding protein [Polaromonas hydrogenivorans]|uniref:tripartite tricarboxylate transporter substrate-binding protein n=1 Tax=Polaromonas hydrogenivorans TaxID=335476 RepID=UPI0039EF2166
MNASPAFSITRRAALVPAVPGGQGVVIDSLPGAGGITGSPALAKAAPDGLTIGVEANTHAINPSVFDILPSLKEGDSYGATHEFPHA